MKKSKKEIEADRKFWEYIKVQYRITDQSIHSNLIGLTALDRFTADFRRSKNSIKEFFNLDYFRGTNEI